MVDINVSIKGLQMKNPVLTASGTFGYGEEYSDFIDLNRLGGIIVKGTTRYHREGNPYPRMAETPAGMLNAVGLQNKGVDYFVKEIYPRIKDIQTNLIVNVSGSAIEDYVETASIINELSNIPAIELNISCPNIKQGGMAFGVTAKGAEEVVAAVRKTYHKTLIVKLSPNVTDICEIARAAEAGGADSVSLINTVLGMAIDASAIEIWTDVDGVRTADPRKVGNTKCIERISFEEAAEMAHFGAKVLHPLTIEPAVNKNIPIYVLNSMNPEGKGTVILQNSFIEDGVKSVSFKENIHVINIFSTKMINTSGFLKKVFEIFSVNKVSVDLISTSEANISVTVDSSQKIDKVVEQLSEFSDVYVDSDKSQISIIGKNIINIKGLLQKAFAPLADCRIYMISQGASYVNLSFVVDREVLTDAVCQIHKYLFENEGSN